MSESIDRRSDNQWIRDGFANTNSKLGDLETAIKDSETRLGKDISEVKVSLDKIHATLTDGMLSGASVHSHRVAHEKLAAEQLAREDSELETKEFRKELIKKVKMGIVMAALPFIVGIMTLGFTAQFKLWVLSALGGIPAAVGDTK